MAPFTQRLESFGPLSLDDKRFLDQSLRYSRNLLPTYGRGATPTMSIVLTGMAYLYKGLPDGQRQILAFMVPGDFYGLNAAVLSKPDHGVGGFPGCSVADMPRDDISELMERPSIAHAVDSCRIVEQAIAYEWIINLGRRSAEKRVAHLFCELCSRLIYAGVADQGGFEWRGTQVDLADALGLSLVHTNRTLQNLRSAKMLTVKGHFVSLDFDSLQKLCGFNPSYLHLDRQAEHAPWLFP